MVDRKNDKNCDVGAFELAFKQPLVTVPPYIGISLSVEGQGVRKPGNTSLRRSFNENSNVNESTVTQRTPLRLSHSEKVDNLGTKRTLSGQVSAVTTGAHVNNHKKDSESLENSPGTSTLKFSYGGYVESNPSLVQIDGKNGGTLRIKSHSSENQTENKKIKSERVGEIVTKQSSDGKAPSTHLFPRSHSVYLQQTPLLYDVGNKRILSRTSVSNNYVIPASQSGGGYVRPLAVNNVESTDLKSFKPVKGNEADYRLVSFPPAQKVKKTIQVMAPGRGKPAVLGSKLKRSKSNSRLKGGNFAICFPKVSCSNVNLELPALFPNDPFDRDPPKLRYFNIPSLPQDFCRWSVVENEDKVK